MGSLPTPLVDTAWLEEQLDAPDLRIFDCTVFRASVPDALQVFTSGRPEWLGAHIPGSGFADLLDLSIHNDVDWFMLPPADELAASLGALGIGDGTRVVLYDSGYSMWAARLWWMLRWLGFDEAAVLDGGFPKWKAEGRPLSDRPTNYGPARLEPRVRHELLAETSDASAAMSDPATVLVNAVSEEQHRGTGGPLAGRPGHIPTSVNVPYAALVDPETGAYLPPAALRELFEERGGLAGDRVIAYCGGGIAASSAALALHVIGEEDVRLYDGSLRAWSQDPELPLETG